MKKKLFVFLALCLSVFTFTACAKGKSIDLKDHLIEDRENLFTAQDDLYSLTFSTGKRESDYALDGVKTDMVDFGVLTFVRLTNEPLANDVYTYEIKVDEERYTGFLQACAYDNTYVADLGVCVNNNAQIHAEISFTGYHFDADMQNVSNNFAVDKATAMQIANKELNKALNNLLADKNNCFESLIKIVKDHSDSELQHYYWYIGVVSTNSDILGVLIDATSGEVVAKKV